MRNVARCWAYETSVLLGAELPDVRDFFSFVISSTCYLTNSQPLSQELPMNDFFEYYGPDYRLHITPSNMENLNSREYLEFLKVKLLQQLDGLEAVPGVQIHTGQSGTEVPRDAAVGSGVSRAEATHPDARLGDNGAFFFFFFASICFLLWLIFHVSRRHGQASAPGGVFCGG